MPARFAVPNGHCRGEFDGVLLSTDLEPDDIIAIKILAPRLRGVRILAVVGQGPCDKTQMMSDILAAFGIDNHAEVVQGRTSTIEYPRHVLGAFAAAGASSSAVISEADAAERTLAFLKGCSAPFALLLKPPMELIGIEPSVLCCVTAALYGSFNLESFRSALGDREMSTEDRFASQEALMHSFRRLLWFERSLSVGRDSVLDPKRAPELWDWLKCESDIVQVVHAWNAEVMRGFAPKVEGIMRDIAATTSTEPDFQKLQVVLEVADKKVAIMNSIAQCDGLQVCHADTLVAATLIDASGILATYERRCRVGRTANMTKPAPVYEESDGSTVCILAAEGEARAKLETESIAVLVTSVTGGGGRGRKRTTRA